MSHDAIDPGARIGHVHLKVSDLERAIAFYRDVLGFELTQRYGSGGAFLSAGGYHHHIGLNTWESAGGRRRPAAPVFSIWRSSIRHEPRWPILCADCNEPVLRWKELRIMA